MSKNRRRKKKDTFQVNLGTVIFCIIFIYTFIQVLISFSKERLAIYEVQNSYIDTNIHSTALIVRSETLATAERSGYVSYYVRDGEKIGKDKTIYTIDETGSVYNKMKDMNPDAVSITKTGLQEIRNRISNFENYFDFSDFSEIYNFRYDIENTVLELTNEAFMEQLTSIDHNDANRSTYKKINTTNAGIVTYYEDGYENFDINNFKADSVRKNTYSKKTLKTGEIINAGDPVYKLITSENWYLVAPITEEEAAYIKDQEYVTINIHNSPKNITCEFELKKKDSQNFVIISLNQQMVNYINDRFIDIVILQNQNNGLKIPNTSITQKSVYKIPRKYLSKGSDSTEEIFFNLKKLDENGNVTLKQISPYIYIKEEAFCYVDPNDFRSDDVLTTPDGKDVISVAQLEKMKIDGVYCVNQGIANFRYIDTIYQDNEYTIVRSDVDYSIAWYDRIVLNQQMVKENQIIK